MYMHLSSLGLTAVAYCRFVDRDMAARHLGMSVGSGELQAHERESMMDDPAILEEIEAAARVKIASTTARGDEDTDQVAASVLDDVEDEGRGDMDGSDSSSSADNDALVAHSDIDTDE